VGKEVYPIQAAEYAVANKLVSEPAFSWWVPYTLRKRDRVIKSVRRRAFARKTEKFGIEIPKPMDVTRAFEIDSETNTTHWAIAMEKEVKTVLPALDVKAEGDTSVPIGSQPVGLLTVLDVKMDMTGKVRICARGDQTDAPLSVTYASVITRESIRLGFLIAALNDLNVLSADVAGAYLNAPCAERVHTVLGREFGELHGRTTIIVKALYGLKSAGYAWRTLLARTLREEMGFKPCQGDMDVWRREAVKANGDKYYEYILVYVDDCLAISEFPRKIMDALAKRFFLKPGSVEESTRYLGATISKFYIDGDSKAKWAIGSQEYVKEALRVVKARLEKMNMTLRSKVSSVLPTGYKPKLDGSPEVNAEGARFTCN
jgi:hypothetical protein